jgi:hypothetical protein
MHHTTPITENDFNFMLAEIDAGRLCFLDTETCGFHGIAVLLQYAMDDGEIYLYELWKEPFSRTLRLFEALAQRDLIGFNLSFDAFHMCKTYTVWSAVVEQFPSFADAIPEDHLDLVIACEMDGRDGLCWKPRSACDIMLWCRKNKYQTLMRRPDIRIRRVPVQLAYVLAEELEERIDIPDIYFAKFKERDARWRVFDIEDEVYFKDVVLKFNAAGGLKYLAEHALGITPDAKFEDIELDPVYRPDEIGYAPHIPGTIAKFGEEGLNWGKVVRKHIEHWHSEPAAREYAKNDIVYTRGMYEHIDSPEPGDDDSELACMVAAVRWHGFEIDLDGIAELRVGAQAVVDAAPINVNKHNDVRLYLGEVMDDLEYILIADSVRKEILVEIISSADWQEDNPAAVERCQQIMNIKIAAKEVELYDKLLLAGRLHASLNVIGTKSSRMSGGGGLNVQGIKKAKFVRRKFPMCWDGTVLCGGDFDSYEVTLADAVYNDRELRESLLSGKKIHGMFGTALYPGQTYEQILASEGHPTNDMYSKAKQGVFALIYGGNANTLCINLGLSLEDATAAYAAWLEMFPGIGDAMARISDRFMALQQPGGLGTGISWVEPDECIETKAGFKRYFTLENMVAKTLFELAQAPPKKWKEVKIKVARRDRLQTASGAAQSALYGAAFSILSAVVRAAANHEIQCLGATICKQVQRAVWDIQPCGANPFRVAPLNIHDEILSATDPDYVDEVAEVIETAVESHRDMVPLIGITWNLQQDNWADKKHGAVVKFIGPLKNPQHAGALAEEQTGAEWYDQFEESEGAI